MFTTLGDKTKTTFLTTEAHKTTVEFEAGVAVKKGQPVMLMANGKVQPWDGVSFAALIGYAYGDAAIGINTTVWTRGYAMIFAISSAAMAAGPATYDSFNAATNIGGLTGYSVYKPVGVGIANGWVLDQTTAANQLVRVLLAD